MLVGDASTLRGRHDAWRHLLVDAWHRGCFCNSSTTLVAYFAQLSSSVPHVSAATSLAEAGATLSPITSFSEQHAHTATDKRTGASMPPLTPNLQSGSGAQS